MIFDRQILLFILIVALKQSQVVLSAPVTPHETNLQSNGKILGATSSIGSWLNKFNPFKSGAQTHSNPPQVLPTTHLSDKTSQKQKILNTDQQKITLSKEQKSVPSTQENSNFKQQIDNKQTSNGKDEIGKNYPLKTAENNGQKAETSGNENSESTTHESGAEKVIPPMAAAAGAAVVAAEAGAVQAAPVAPAPAPAPAPAAPVAAPAPGATVIASAASKNNDQGKDDKDKSPKANKGEVQLETLWRDSRAANYVTIGSGLLVIYDFAESQVVLFAEGDKTSYSTQVTTIKTSKFFSDPCDIATMKGPSQSVIASASSACAAK